MRGNHVLKAFYNLTNTPLALARQSVRLSIRLGQPNFWWVYLVNFTLYIYATLQNHHCNVAVEQVFVVKIWAEVFATSVVIETLQSDIEFGTR